jgi:hypothetical protein
MERLNKIRLQVSPQNRLGQFSCPGVEFTNLILLIGILSESFVILQVPPPQHLENI